MKKRRCKAMRVDGEACRAWAVRDLAGGAPLCAAHGGLEGRGTAGDGQKGRAVVDPIVLHGGGARQAARAPRAARALQAARGLYGDFFGEAESVALEGLAGERSVESEVQLVRVALRRLLADFGREEARDARRLRAGAAGGAGEGMSVGEMNERALILFRGAEAVGRLLQIQKGLEADRDALPHSIELALDALGEELGLDL